MECDPDIFDAVEFGDLETVISYCTDHNKIDYQDLRGETLLMLAVRNNHPSIVSCWLTHTPTLTLLNQAGQSVFDMARRLEDQQIDQMLKKHPS